MVHAGIYPTWSEKKALKHSIEVQKALQSETFESFLTSMYTSRPLDWHGAKHTEGRLPFIVNVFTRMRYLYPDYKLNFSEKCAPSDAIPELIPWFNVPNKNISPQTKVIFGHWASLLGKTGKPLPPLCS